MKIQLSESLTNVTLLDLKWAVNQRYVEPDPIWVGLNSISLISTYKAGQLNKLGYQELTQKRFPVRIKNGWCGNWSDLINLVSKIVEIPSGQVEYQLKRFTQLNGENPLSIRLRNFYPDYKVFAQGVNLPKDGDDVFWLYDYHPLTHKLRPIPMQLLKEQFMEYESRYLM